MTNTIILPILSAFIGHTLVSVFHLRRYIRAVDKSASTLIEKNAKKIDDLIEIINGQAVLIKRWEPVAGDVQIDYIRMNSER